MKSKWGLILSVAELTIGVLGVLAFIVLSFSGENRSGYIPALILSIFLVFLGFFRISNYVRKHENKRMPLRKTIKKKPKNDPSK